MGKRKSSCSSIKLRRKYLDITEDSNSYLADIKWDKGTEEQNYSPQKVPSVLTLSCESLQELQNPEGPHDSWLQQV